jgi:hypothetical protein
MWSKFFTKGSYSSEDLLREIHILLNAIGETVSIGLYIITLGISLDQLTRRYATILATIKLD